LKYLLDTNAVITLARRHPAFEARLMEHAPTDFGLPAIALHELYYGAYKGRRTAENLARIEALQFEVVAFDAEDARAAGALRAALAAGGAAIGPYDALIAGQAVARDLTLITHNTGEFQRVAGLRVEDWER
jgi:tRNA(fMet)-specific endonuclease VapC